MPENWLFDCNVYVGRPMRSVAGEWFDDARSLLHEMDYYCIERALITHYSAREAHPDIGNPETIRLASESRRLVPAWSFLPSVGRNSDAERFIDIALRSGVRLLRYYPNEYFVTFSENAIGDYLEIMQERLIPLFVDFSTDSYGGEFQTDWESLISVCRSFPNLTVITTEYRIRSNRMLFRALSLCENLRICTSAVWLFKNIEFIVSEFGKHRLIFGTNLPSFDPSIPISMLLYAGVPDETRRAIGRENLNHLLQEVRV